jgi:hypothetical protein
MANKKEDPAKKEQEALNKAFEKSTGMPVVTPVGDVKGNTTFSKDTYVKEK